MQRYGYSIFCDDIRQEAGDKLSFIGCYNGVMFVSGNLPLVLPKFCVHLHVFCPATEPYTSVVARCYAPAQEVPIAEEAIDVPPIEDQLKLVSTLDPRISAPRYIVVAASLIFEPLEIRSPGLISVRAVLNYEPKELQLGSLSIVKTDARRGT
jgi:hypothetical protein